MVQICTVSLPTFHIPVWQAAQVRPTHLAFGIHVFGETDGQAGFFQGSGDEAEGGEIVFEESCAGGVFQMHEPVPRHDFRSLIHGPELIREGPVLMDVQTVDGNQEEQRKQASF